MRRRIRYTGIVQGVGFRPFIYRLAVGHGLMGFVQNRPDGVIVEIEGPEESIGSFRRDISANLPPRAEVSSITESDIPPRRDKVFRIIESSDEGHDDGHIAPDMATCADCRRELFSPADRRHRYPFINCTNCGPRLTIITDTPYDRPRTSMSRFPLCDECLHEYRNPADRRFHAEPNACPACGPRLTLLDAEGRVRSVADPLHEAITLLESGSILALKGLGGFQLAVDACHHPAVKRLRGRKYREEKPLAVMVRDIEAASSLVAMNEAERELLLTPAAPIVLIAKGPDPGLLSPAVAPGMGNIGVMLPTTPLHHLLLSGRLRALVMTSGNRTDEPICIDNREAVERLRGVADSFLVHDREIVVRCDDSVALVLGGSAAVVRRSRGYAPKPLPLREEFPPVLALGSQTKSTLCLIKGNLAFLSPHIGDLETPLARDFFQETVTLMERITECRPDLLACDLHPDYYSSRFAARLRQAGGATTLLAIQHHHAHIVSCMAENGLTGQVIGLAMDGSGYGTDGHVWGGEFLVADERTFTRIGHLKEFPLPGGEKAVREPWRIAAALLREAYGSDWAASAVKAGVIPDGTDIRLLERMMDRGLNTPPASSLGRFIDGIAALLGIRRTVTFEGQAAMELEGMAGKEQEGPLPFTIIPGETLILDFTPAVRMLADTASGTPPRPATIAAIHRTFARAFTGMAIEVRARTGLGHVCLSGGCFQNRLLLEGTVRELKDAGFLVFHHRQVPTNDGGLSLGQAVCAASRMRSGMGPTDHTVGYPSPKRPVNGQI